MCVCGRSSLLFKLIHWWDLSTNFILRRDYAMKVEDINTSNDDIKQLPQERGADGAVSGVEQEVASEVTYPFDPEQISISSKVVPLSYLLEQISDGSISAPQIQRGANLWTPEQQSRLIESLMLRIPLPLFYVSIDKEEHWYIVDGLQRISAIRNYILDEKFKLSGLEFLKSECEGIFYRDLPQKYKKRIKETQLQFATINATTPPGVQRAIFKRLNTGGLPLSAQEIRHALYYGNSASFLEKLSLSDVFVNATTGSINDSRMSGRELILRFIAFLVRGVEAYPRNDDMDSFLSEAMQLMNMMPDMSKQNFKKVFYELPEHTGCKYTNLDDIESKFILAMERACVLFERHAFRKSTPHQNYRTPINKALFETLSVILAEMSDEDFEFLYDNKDKMWIVLNDLFNGDPNFVFLISRDSLKSQSVNKRFGLLENAFSGLIE